jgi:alpha-N-arabinofuranosidase
MVPSANSKGFTPAFLAVVVAACSPDTATTPNGSGGGGVAVGGTSGTGGTSAVGGNGGALGGSGALGGTGGTNPSGGGSGVSTGGAAGSEATGGASGSAGDGGVSGSATGGTSGSAGSGGTSGSAGSGGSTAGSAGMGGGGNACNQGDTSGAAPNTLTINVDSAQTTISREIFGALMERLGRGINGGLYVGSNSTVPNTNGMRNDIIDGFKEAGVGMIQWPGGCAGNNYNWQPPNPSNDLGTDRYMQLSTLVGSEPYITGGGTAATASRNLAWVTYINNNASHPEWNLKHFKVGNEVWGCGGDQTEATYRTNYQANHDVLAPPINGKQLKLVAGNDLIGNFTWLETQLQNIASIIDGIEIHDYIYFPDTVPCVGFTDDQYYNIVHRANRGQIGPRIDQIKTILDRYDSGKRIKIYLDEWGDWLMGFNEAQDTWLQQITVMDAISSAEQLHLFMQHSDRIFMAAVAQPINVIHSLFLTRQSDGVLVKTPAFYVFKMFIPHHSSGAKWAPNTLTTENVRGNNTNIPVISAGTSVDSQGRVNVSLANVDLVNPRTVQITLNSTRASYRAVSAQIITGPAKDTYNDFGQPERVNIQTLAASSCTISGKTVKVTLPSKSVVMLVLAPE